MKKIKIPFDGLKEGIHKFDAVLGKEFIEDYVDNIAATNAELNIKIILHKLVTVSHLEVYVEGNLTLPCDRCLNEVKFPVDIDETVYIKQGNKSDASEDDDNIIYINNNESEIDCTHFIYESIVLSIPLSVTHDDDEDETAECDDSYLKFISSNDNKDNNDIDPRWEQLRKLK